MPPDLASQAAPLPAPYENPWGLLARDCRAVVATLRLQARQLWRRNRQGDLSLPPFWPAGLAPFFWPLSLALAGGLLALLVAGLGGVIAPGPRAQLSQPTLQPVPLEVSFAEGLSAEVAPALPAPQSGEFQTAASPDAPSFSATDQSPTPRSAEPLPPEPDPLAEAMVPIDPGHWITAIDSDPERGTLKLVLAARFTALPEAQQRQQAETWQNQAMALGFDRLELTDRQGRPIGRQARVGSGMILLTPQHLS